jgi:hypothetical protein
MLLAGNFTKVGGWTRGPWRDPTDATTAFVAEWRDAAESKLGFALGACVPKRYRRSTQVVAGTNVSMQAEVTLGDDAERPGAVVLLDATQYVPLSGDPEAFVLATAVVLNDDGSVPEAVVAAEDNKEADEAVPAAAAAAVGAVKAAGGAPGDDAVVVPGGSSLEDLCGLFAAAGAGGGGVGGGDGAPGGSDSLEDLCGLLISQINTSDWLDNNPPTGESLAGWVKDPES